MSIRILCEEELRKIATIDSHALSVVEEAFNYLAHGRAVVPPVMHMDVARYKGAIDIKSAYVEGVDCVAVKIASGFFENYKLGLPSCSAMVVLLDASTGMCKAVLLDNGYLTDLRTGLAGAVAARHLAPQNIDTVGVVGAGAQARYQIESLRLVRDFRQLLVYSRNKDKAAAYASEMSAKFGIDIRAVDDCETLVRASQLVVTTTPSTTPIIKADWLHPGLHITAMGSDLPGKQELEADVLTRADIVVCDRQAQCAIIGELQHASQTVSTIELGDITSRKTTGRMSQEQITVCDLTGVGVQDTAIGALAYQRAVAANMGFSL